MKSTLIRTSMRLSKLLEVLHWVGVGATVVIIILCFAAPDFLANEGVLADHPYLSIGGFSVSLYDANGNYDVTSLTMFSFAALQVFALMALILRNVSCILRNTYGGTPFTTENVRRMKMVGIFTMAIAAAGVTVGCVATLVFELYTSDLSVDYYSLIIGLVILCLTQVFARGVKLEEDVDGLV